MADTDSRSGLDYSNPEIAKYLEALHSPHTPAMQAALDDIENEGLPPIQISRTEGKILSVLARMVRAENVVELGTLSGYSALWLLEGMPPEGRLWTLEHDPKHAEIARKVFRNAGRDKQVTLLEGSAQETLPSLEKHGPFDLMFIDGDKENYDKYVRWGLDHLRSGGLIIADNAYLFGYLKGKQADDSWDRDAIATMQRAHEMLAAESESVCLPTPDGLLLGLKR